MVWFDLVTAGLFEVFWATMMKHSHGFSQLGFSIATLVGMALSFYFLSLATKQLPFRLAYPIWTGIGAVGSIVVGVFFFKDVISPLTWVFIVMLLVGILGIKFTA